MTEGSSWSHRDPPVRDIVREASSEGDLRLEFECQEDFFCGGVFGALLPTTEPTANETKNLEASSRSLAKIRMSSTYLT